MTLFERVDEYKNKYDVSGVWKYGYRGKETIAVMEMQYHNIIDDLELKFYTSHDDGEWVYDLYV